MKEPPFRKSSMQRGFGGQSKKRTALRRLLLSRKLYLFFSLFSIFIPLSFSFPLLSLVSSRNHKYWKWTYKRMGTCVWEMFHFRTKVNNYQKLLNISQPQVNIRLSTRDVDRGRTNELFVFQLYNMYPRYAIMRFLHARKTQKSTHVKCHVFLPK